MAEETAKEKLETRLAEIEAAMNAVDFWSNKEIAQQTIREYQDVKDQLSGVGKFDRGNAVLTVFGGAGGTDAEDFARMLLEMYVKYITNHGWNYTLLHDNQNDHGGYRNVTIEVVGKEAYGTLKNESGVHRLVRISPFDASKKRHTSFAMVEVVPALEDVEDVDIPESELEIEFSKSSGPGGQNVNKRETAVRIVHTPTGLSASASSERSQERNRDKALAILRGTLYHEREREKKAKEQGLSVSTTTKNEWGSQIRSYVLHPYQLVKDHRTDVESRDVDKILDGELDLFITAERQL